MPSGSGAGVPSGRDADRGDRAKAYLDNSGIIGSGGASVVGSVNKHWSSLSSLGDASGVAILLGNHAKFGLAERCCYHFDLMGTLTSLPTGRLQHTKPRRRDRGLSVSSQEGCAVTIPEKNSTGGSSKRKDAKQSSASNAKAPSSSDAEKAKDRALCGVVSLLECVAGGGGGTQPPDRTTKRTLRSKHREFNARAQAAWGRSAKQRGKAGGAGNWRRCHQPRHLPLPVNPNSRVSFAYELTSIAIVVDASPSLTAATFGVFDFGDFGEEKKSGNNSDFCVPLDRLGPLMKTYLKGLVQPIDVPPMAVSGLGVAFGQWRPNLAVTVVAYYPPTAGGNAASAGLLVRDFRVTDEASALELAGQIERWAWREVEGTIADRMCGEIGEGRFGGEGARGYVPEMAPLDPFSFPSTHMGPSTRVKSSMKDILAVGDAALSTLPPEGRPVLLLATDCCNIHCGGVFDSLSETTRSDVPINVIDLSPSTQQGLPDMGQPSITESSPFQLSTSDSSRTALRDVCQMSGGILLNSTLLDSHVNTMVGSAPAPPSPLQTPAPSHSFTTNYHFAYKKRSIKPNALQWFTLFILSPFTPGGSSSLRPMGTLGPSSFFRSASVMSISGSSVSSAKQIMGKSAELGPENQERVIFAKYNIQPVRIKSLLMTRVLEGYRARRYGHNTQDNDKVSVHLVLRLIDCGIVLHYEASFISSPYHIATVGQAHIKLELSGDADFIQTVKKVWTQYSHGTDSIMLQGRRVSSSSRAAADKICKLLRWTRKEDYLESYLCLPGWGDINHFAGSSFLSRVESLSKLQRYRHFRSEMFEVVAHAPHHYEKSLSLFSDMMEQNQGKDEMYEVLSRWSSGTISDCKMYFKEIISAQEDDLAYYCTIRVVPSPAVTRLFTITVDFHGEISAEKRLTVLSSLKDALREKRDYIIVLEKCISNDVAAVSTTLAPHWSKHFLHHKSWELLKEDEVLPLITKRRNEIGNFFILESDERRTVFAKFVQSKEERLCDRSADAVVYQVRSRSDGIFVDIHMEATQSTFYPFHPKHPSTFKSIYEKVKSRDKDCAKNVRSRANLLGTLDYERGGPESLASNGSKQAEDVLRLIKLSTCTKRKLRFFNKEAGVANDILCRLTAKFITSDSFHHQAAKLTIDQGNAILNFSGLWFIVRGGWESVSVICLEDPSLSNEGPMQSFRSLTFFTVGVMDLYQSDDDVSDATLDATPEDDSEHLEVSEITHEIESAHAENFAKACYAALRDTSAETASLHKEEVAYLLSSCTFQEVLHAFVSVDDLSAHLSTDAQTLTGQKLGAVIGTLLGIVPGSDGDLFFYHGAETDCSNETVSGNISDDTEFDMDHSNHALLSDEGDSVDGVQFLQAEEGALGTHETDDRPPVFFRFTLDQGMAGMDDILALKKSATLAAQISIFGAAGEKLDPHLASAASKLQKALDTFTSEQTLEKYRFLGRSLTEEDFKTVMENLPKTKHRALEIPLVFFISKPNCLIPAKNPTGNETDLDNAFCVLMDQLDESEYTVRASQDSFLVLDDSASRDVLPYWCFIKVRRRGSIILRLHHPLGDEAAEKQAKATKLLVEGVSGRTNQHLLLASLYRTKRASNLLICEEEEQAGDGKDSKEASPVYSCPELFREGIPLHRRCAPKQAIMSLETSILQNFMISNRPGYFVFKDESGVFYLTLNWRKVPDADETEQNPHIVELLVYGCDKPGPSITDQLVALLRRKLLTLTLDALSSLLKKNPWFNLLASDMAFIKNFGSDQRELGLDSTHSPGCDRYYALPPYVKDPLILLLMFRQNICGSTFIQQLHHESLAGDFDPVHIDENDAGNVQGLQFSKLPDPEFLFYFNSSPSQLDPNYQPLATLTEKGREYSRQAGSGIAIIDVNIQRGKSSECHINVGEKGAINNNLRVSKSDISLGTDTSRDDQFNMRVAIVNTTVDIDVIHKWVELSLSQVLIAWSIERHLESLRLGPIGTEADECAQDASVYEPTEQTHLKSLHRLIPGLPALMDMMTVASSLPHPAIVTVQKTAMLSSAALANHTLLLLEAMLDSIVRKKNVADAVDIIRSTANSRESSRVNITKTKNGVNVQTKEGRALKDNPTDSPEYTVVFGLNDKSQKSSSDVLQSQFFKEVSVAVSTHQEASTFAQAMSRIKSEKRSLFHRHLVFILRVSRSTRTLLSYNSNPTAQRAMSLAFNELEQDAIKASEQSRGALQSRCLRHISFFPSDPIKPKTAASEPSADPTPQKVQEKKPAKEEVIAKRGPARRIPRPTSMLRPKLIGKSVEGAAMQAVAASRLRASTRPSVPQRRMPSSSGRKTVVAPHRDKPKEKATHGERRVSESNTKAAPIVRSPVPRTSLLKTYRAFLSLLKEVSDSLSTQPRLNQSTLQQMWHTFFVSAGERGASLISTRLISMCYGTLISTGSIQPLLCDGEVSSAKVFVNHIKKRWGTKNIVPIVGMEDQPANSRWPQLLYLKKDLLKSPTRGATILIEISASWDSYHNTTLLCYKGWLVSTADKAKADKLSRKSFTSSSGREQEAAIIEAIAADFFAKLHLEEEMFNFSCLRVLKMARGVRGDGSNASALGALKSIITRWPGGDASTEYNLQRRFLATSSFLEGPLLESCDKRSLTDHLLSNCPKHNLICSGQGSNMCFAGRLKVAGLVVHYFIAWHESVQSALDVFILCVTKDQRLDGYITKEGSPYAERISDVVLYSTMSMVQDLIKVAAECIRKNYLWRLFGEGYSNSSPLPLGTTLIDNVAELRNFSFHLDLSQVDPRLKLLLQDELDELDELQLSWRDVFAAIARSPLFSHCISFDLDQGSQYIVYYEEEDMFLDVTLNQVGRVQEARMLAKEQICYDESSLTVESVTMKGAVQKFTMFLLQWMWLDTEVAF